MTGTYRELVRTRFPSHDYMVIKSNSQAVEPSPYNFISDSLLTAGKLSTDLIIITPSPPPADQQAESPSLTPLSSVVGNTESPDFGNENFVRRNNLPIPGEGRGGRVNGETAFFSNIFWNGKWKAFFCADVKPDSMEWDQERSS